MTVNGNELPLVSLIIPIYMVIGYLDRCIDSIVNQTYGDLEIILVDDGSSDECAVKCDKWAKKDTRITVLHKPNGGQADARNYGMQIANGKYISFIDSDDYISEYFIGVMLTTALKRNSDIVVCDYVKCFENGNYNEYHDDLAVSDYSTLRGLSALIDENPFHLHVWDKLYKREVIHGFHFEVGRIHEDVFWLYQAFGHSEKITKINKTMYYYLQRKTSTMAQDYSLRRLDYLEGKKNSWLYIEQFYPKLALKSKLDFFDSCIYTMQCVIRYLSGSEKQQAISLIRKYKKECRLKFKDIRAVNGSSRKYYYLAKINLFLCCKLRAELNIGF